MAGGCLFRILLQLDHEVSMKRFRHDFDAFCYYKETKAIVSIRHSKCLILILPIILRGKFQDSLTCVQLNKSDLNCSNLFIFSSSGKDELFYTYKIFDLDQNSLKIKTDLFPFGSEISLIYECECRKTIQQYI